MKNFFKNKNFYFGLAAVFAVIAGLYFALPANLKNSDTVQTNVTEASTEKTDEPTAVTQPAVNKVELKNTVPANEVKPVNVDMDGKKDTPNVDQTVIKDADKI